MFEIIIIVIAIILFYYIITRGKEAAPFKGNPRGNLNVTRKVTLHFAPWCPACKNFRGTWDKLRANLASTNVVFLENDEEKNKTVGIYEYPSLVMVTEEGWTQLYHGDLDYHSIERWIKQPNF